MAHKILEIRAGIFKNVVTMDYKITTFLEGAFTSQSLQEYHQYQVFRNYNHEFVKQ